MSIRARVRDGDPAAFEELFDECARSVYNHAFRLTGDWTAAEDVVSLTFLEAWRLRGRLDADGGSVRPWLLGIATNVARNLRRAARRYDDVLVRLPRSEVVPDFADELIGRIDDVERLVAIQEAYGVLRCQEQDVFALCVWSGLDYAEAAEALGIPVGTVRSRLSRARKKLEKLAERRREPPPGRRQVDGDRGPAVRSAKEDDR
ncbi:RNA polymerase sigma factor [Nonomuraea africana]|uniref:RNA polymerase sigma-70 factor (ECF subfamily) n=1 Tax=Nonomuraea africana TaxID=46171 RepID=A0ABR9KK06_9ACTN|nr:RNA polymerase sigma factor [Nonomuraea africana]MBE1562155.1 RNA polymerase sigma-70 factor (ECF subfamily) [Nonomuraea africana]